MKAKLKPIAIGHLLSVICFSAPAQGTAFTYQGRLNDGPNPATGIYDLRFTIYDILSGGGIIAGPITNSPTGVTNGLFTVTLDFGANVFTNANRFLEIGVRTNGGGSFTALNARQKLTPAPYAVFAENVGTGGLTAGTYGNAVTFDNSANSFSGSFSGNGASITNVNALTLGGLASSNFWRLDGNNASASQFLGTTNNQALEIRVNNTRALRIEPSSAPSLVGGYFQNNANGFAAVVIAGGGTSGSLNQALGNYAFVGAGHGGQAGSFSAVVDGGYNVSPSQFSFIGSGLANTNLANYSFIGSGTNNLIQAASSASVIGGGQNNVIQTNSIDGTIAGGEQNIIGANAGAATIGGGFLNLIQANAGSSTIGGGWANVIQSNSGYNTLGGGLYNTIGGNYGTLGGGDYNTSSGLSATVGGGGYNTSSGLSATVGGGGDNTSSGDCATVGGGEDNSSSSHSSTVGGGQLNTSSGDFATVGGGRINTSGGYGTTVGGGQANVSGASYSTVAGGIANYATGPGSSVGGGGYDGNGISGNRASGLASVVGGGLGNLILGNWSTIGGGSGNSNSGAYATVNGGVNNSVTVDGGSIGGGNANQVNNVNGTVSGGVGNVVGGNAGTIAGGALSVIESNAFQATIGGGYQNRIQSPASRATIGGGEQNISSGFAATVSGGSFNTGGGAYAVVPGGYFNSATGSGSFAAGSQARANHQGSFVWADSQNADFTSTAVNQFNIRAGGGVRLSDNTPNLSFGATTRQMFNLYGAVYGIGVQSYRLYFRTDAGAGFAWFMAGTHNDATDNPGAGGTELMRLDNLGNLSVRGIVATNVSLTSDRSVKENFKTIDARAVLQKVAGLPLSEWNFKSDSGVRHIGPMAQDFYAAFNVGSDDKHIAVVDEGGVALAAIQGLNQELEEERKSLRAELRVKDGRIETMEQRLSQLESLIARTIRTKE